MVFNGVRKDSIKGQARKKLRDYGVDIVVIGHPGIMNRHGDG